MHNTGYKQNMWLISSITWKKKKSLCSSQEENKILHSIIQFPCKKTQTFSFPANHKFIHYVTAYFDSLVPNKIWVNFQNPTVLWDMQNRWLGGTGRENITITQLHMKIGCIHTVNSIHLCLYHFNYFFQHFYHTYIPATKGIFRNFYCILKSFSNHLNEVKTFTQNPLMWHSGCICTKNTLKLIQTQICTHPVQWMLPGLTPGRAPGRRNEHLSHSLLQHA